MTFHLRYIAIHVAAKVTYLNVTYGFLHSTSFSQYVIGEKN